MKKELSDEKVISINSNEVSRIQIEVEKPADTMKTLKSHESNGKLMRIKVKYDKLDEEALMNINIVCEI